HMSDQSPYFQETKEHGKASHYYDFFDRDSYGSPTHYFDWTNLPNLNYDNPEVRAMITEAFVHWIRDYGIDGFRVDAAWCVERRPARAGGDERPEGIRPRRDRAAVPQQQRHRHPLRRSVRSQAHPRRGDAAVHPPGPPGDVRRRRDRRELRALFQPHADPVEGQVRASSVLRTAHPDPSRRPEPAFARRRRPRDERR